MIYEDDSHSRYCDEIEGGNVSFYQNPVYPIEVLTYGLLDYRSPSQVIIDDFIAGLDKMIKEIEKSYDKYIKEIILNEIKTNKR